jgi:transposase-like protein
MARVYRFPHACWIRLRSTNPIESIFSPVRNRADAMKHLRTGSFAVAVARSRHETFEEQTTLARPVRTHSQADLRSDAQHDILIATPVAPLHAFPRS